MLSREEAFNKFKSLFKGIYFQAFKSMNNYVILFENWEKYEEAGEIMDKITEPYFDKIEITYQA